MITVAYTSRKLLLISLLLLIWFQISACQVDLPTAVSLHTTTPIFLTPSPSFSVTTIINTTPTLAGKTVVTPERLSGANLLLHIMSLPGKYLAATRYTGKIAKYGSPETELVLFDEAGDVVGSLAVGPGFDARLSSDNHYVAFSEEMPFPAENTAKLLVLNLCTNETISLGDPRSIGGFSWSNEGSELAVSLDGEIYLISFPSGEAQQVTQCKAIGDGAMCENPEISPDGKYIAYTVGFGGPDPDRRAGIYIADTSCLAEGKVCKNTVSPILNPPSAYTWAPDSQSIAIADRVIVKEYSIPLGELKKEFPQAIFTKQNIKWLRWSTKPEALVAIDETDSGFVETLTGVQHVTFISDQPLLGLAGLIVIDETSKPICGN